MVANHEPIHEPLAIKQMVHDQLDQPPQASCLIINGRFLKS